MKFRAEVEVEELDVTDGCIGKVWASKFLEKYINFFINTVASCHNVPVTFQGLWPATVLKIKKE